MVRKLTLEHARAAARGRGGRCLSKEYHDNRAHMRWRCGRGHTWRATLKNVRAGRWCPHCVGRYSTSLEVSRETARAMGGVCLSASYVNTKTRMSWRCAEGHEWRATLGSVKYGGVWCPYCAGRRGAPPVPVPAPAPGGA
jgi:hypothetical protein